MLSNKRNNPRTSRQACTCIFKAVFLVATLVFTQGCATMEYGPSTTGQQPDLMYFFQGLNDMQQQALEYNSAIRRNNEERAGRALPMRQGLVIQRCNNPFQPCQN